MTSVDPIQTTCWVCLSCHLIATLLYLRTSIKYDMPLTLANVYFLLMLTATLVWSYHFTSFWMQAVAWYLLLIFGAVQLDNALQVARVKNRFQKPVSLVYALLMAVFCAVDVAQSTVYADMRMLNVAQYLWLTIMSVTFCVYIGATVSRDRTVGPLIKFLCLFTFLLTFAYEATLMPLFDFTPNISYSIALLTVYFLTAYMISQWRI